MGSERSMVQPSSSSASRYSSSSSPLSLHPPSSSSSASTSDRYLGYSPSARHDRSQHYLPSNNFLDDIAASSIESLQDNNNTLSSSSLSSVNARHFRGYSAPERERERYRYDSDGRLLEQNQKSSPTASPSSSPTQQQQQEQQQPHPRTPQYQHQHHQYHQYQFHPYHHQQHQSHNSIHHYPQYSQPSLSMHESSSNSIQQGVVHPMGSHILPTVGFNNIDPSKKDDDDCRSSPVAQTAINNNGRPSMQAHALPPPSLSPWERGEHEHKHEHKHEHEQEHERKLEQRASSKAINGNNNNDGGDDPRYRYLIHLHTYPPSDNNSNRNNSLPLSLHPHPSSSSSSSPPSPSSSASPSSSSSSVSPSSSSPLSSSSSSPTSAATRLVSNHPPSEATSALLPLLTSTSTAGALPLSTATVPWNRSSLRHEIISMESPPAPASSASFHSLHSSSSHHPNSSHGHGHDHSHSSSSTTPSPPHSAKHSPTIVMKTPPHPTPDSSFSPETQKRNRPSILTTSSTPLPPPAVQPSTVVVVSSQCPSGKAGVGRPPARGEEEEDDPLETDTGSTFDSGQQKKRGSALTMTEKEDQEVPRAAVAGAMAGRERGGGQGEEQISIVRAKRAIHHTNQAAAARAGGDENDYDRDRDSGRAGSPPLSPSSLSFLPSPHTTTSSSHARISNNINSNNSNIQHQPRIRPDQPFHDSPPPPLPVSSLSKRESLVFPPHSSYSQQQQPSDSSSLEYHHQQKRMMGRPSGPSFSSFSTSSSPPPPAHFSSSAATPDHPSSSSPTSQPLSSSSSTSLPIAAGTQQEAAPPAHGRFSPSMNHTPLSFDQTGHTSSYPPVHNPSGPSLNNKRRSLADLLFVPTKIKAKRSSSSSVSSVDSSYRQDETGPDPPGNPNVIWASHPKSASATSTTTTSSMPSSAGATTTASSNVPHHHYQQQQHQQQQRMSLESQTSPPTRKSSTVKGVGKGAGSGGGLGSTSSPKTFQCTGYPGCNMVFTRSEHLARHERKHTGEKPYKCIVANCPRTFSRYDNMIQHTQTHSDRTKRDSLAVVAATSAAGVGSGPHSRSTSVQSTPLLPGRPRGGSSPGVFGPSWDEHHRRTQNNSPAASPYNASPAFSHHHHHHHQQQQQQQHPHPYSPHYQQHPQYQQQQPPHPIQWSLPSGAPAGSSPALSAQYYSHHYGVESHPYLPGHQNPSTPVVRTLKANSRSLPHLQARVSPMASSSSAADSPSVGLQQSMSSMEIEELKRRRSEVLLPSSFSGARAASSTSIGFDQGIGLGMSPFTPTSSHPQSLPQVEKLTAGEQERLNEHRRSAQAMFFKMSAGREGFMDTKRTPEYLDHSSSTGGPSQQQQQHQSLGINTTPRSGSTGSALPQVQQLSALEKDHLLEHRKLTPELIYDARMKRSSNDPADMVVQPLPSRDARSGMQWFSQVSTPSTLSPRSSLTPREGGGSGGAPSVQGPGHSSSSSSSGPSSGDSSMVLPPILGPYEEPQRDRQGRLRSHSSHIHPLSRPSTQLDPSRLAQFSSSEELKDQRQQFDAALSPRLERHWEEQYFPIRKRHVVEAIERMDSRDFLGLKYQVAEHHANEQFRNPEFLGNMTAILCVVRAPHTAWKGDERRQGSQGSFASTSEQGSSFVGSRRTSRDMEVDEAEQRSMAAAIGTSKTSVTTKTEEGASAVKKEPMSDSMDVDDGSSDQCATTSKGVVVQPCQFALDIDVDSFSRDPEPDLRGFESLTINSLFPTRSFVAGFEDTPAESHANASEKNRYLSSHNGYPSNARLGRFYLPERSYRTSESLATQPDPNDRWVCCQFEEYHGVSIWVLENVLDKYHEISRRHKMALTLVGATVHHREAVYSREDWEVHSGEQYEVKTKESVLYPEMIHQVWRDMYHQHHHQPPYQQQQQQRAPMPQVATYEEYQRSLMQSDPRRDSYQPQQQAPPPRDRTGPYYSYNDYRQQHHNLHREDLSSAPSSPQSPHHDELQDENLQQHQQQHQQHQRQGSGASANMHRRISIAELCNPMQSLATERTQRREETASKRTSM